MLITSSCAGTHGQFAAQASPHKTSINAAGPVQRQVVPCATELSIQAPSAICNSTVVDATRGGSVAEWLACWTQAQ